MWAISDGACRMGLVQRSWSIEVRGSDEFPQLIIYGLS